ncbi:double-stranded RNA-binding protein Staufen homolog [Anopheles moucheti]|uniref:double-stranded RNA-binding protein Staufen homolog n=1 Tax=Anopheles moucheti TaxID=186751 RepID=UPI0022F09E15|nr:double-stranded RNA-binding protein Staufen homolog [Anopheles moucheti]
MHGHMAPQQHPGMHPAHQPPPHLTHLTSLPPHSIQRDHPANRLNNARHHHPRGVDHQAAAGMAPHLPMQVPPPTHQPSHQSQNVRKPSGPYYSMHGGIPKSMPLATPHLHPSPPGLGVGPPQPPQPLPPHQHMGSISHPSVVGGNHPPVPGGKIPYGIGGGGGGGGAGGSSGGAAMAQHQQPSVSVHHSVTMQAPPPIPVVSAATPAGTKTRHIPSNTDHKVHHGHGHSVLQSNGNCGPGSKGIATNHHTNQTGSTMDKTKVSGGTASSGGNRHHNHHHNQHQQQQHQPQQQIVSKSNDVPLPKDSAAVLAVTVSAANATPAVANVVPTMTNQTGTTAIAISTPANGGMSSMAEGQNGTVNQLMTTQHSPTDSIEALANIKEKTTMCLVNELARYNKIQHQYRLTGESGPAHKKHFTVTLKLGDEEYTAEGASIKKAQHKAAGDAIAATKYKHPPARTNRRTKTGTKGNVSSFTPTVELNALAMKRGEPTVYTVKAVPIPVSKYGPANGTTGGPVPATATGGRRPMEDKSAPGGAHSPGTGYGGAGRYAADGSTGAPGGNGYWCRTITGPTGIAAGVGGRGGMGGFHPGHQQQQQQHGHHPRDDRHHAPHNYHHHEGYGHHGSSGPVTSVQEFYKATLRVGERTFLGEGHTPQAARHDAAARALEVLKPLTADSAEGKGKAGECPANGDTLSSDGIGTSADGYDPNAELKSPISLVHEIAVQRSLTVVFEVISEKGPPHMTVFVTQCKVGTIVTEGEGTGKKLSKKRAAEKMLEELRKLQSVEQQTYPPSWGESSPGTPGGEKRKSNAKSAAAADGGTAKKKARNLIKEKSIVDVAEKENPISRLMQIQQARKEKQPVYTLMENDRPNVGRRRQFTIEVSASGRQATGVGMTKKAAKWNAAEALLVELGYATESKGPTATGGDGAANKENQSGAANDSSPPGGKRSRKVRFQDEQRNGVPSATQILPNVTSSSGANQGKGETSNDSLNDSIASTDSMGTNSSGVSSASSAAPKAAVGAKKEQLLYLAQLLKFEVQFSDFPKGNHGEYLTLVILSTEPNQLCHGSGASLQESHDEAARGALEILSKIGLDNIKPKAPANSVSDDSTSSVTGTASSTATVSSSGTSNNK